MREVTGRSGPLQGIKVVEFAGIGPGPFAGMMLSDIGADVLRIERSGTPDPRPERFDARGRSSIVLDLKWCEILEHTDVCFAPVVSLAEAPHHAHNVARGTFVKMAGAVQSAPAPRFSATPGRIQSAPAPVGLRADQTLAEWGIDREMIDTVIGGGERRKLQGESAQGASG